MAGPKHQTHEDLTRRHQLLLGSDRSFGLVFAAVFAIIALWPVLSGGSPRIWGVAASVAFLLISMIRPAVLAPLNRLWGHFGLLINRIVNPLVLAIMFFVVLTPFGLVMRLFGKDLLRLRRDPSASSYWIDREPGPAPETMKNQF